MHIGFGTEDNSFNVEFKLGENLKNIIFVSNEGIPEEIIERLHQLRSEVLEKARNELISMMSSISESLYDAADVLSEDSVLDDELNSIAADATALAEKNRVKLDKISAAEK